MKDICLRLNFGEIRDFAFCFGLVSFYYILYIIKASVRTVTASKGNFIKRFGYTT